MSEWKKAFSLASLEIKASMLNLILFIPLFAAVSLFFMPLFTSYLNTNYVGFDFLFLMLFSIAPSWLRSKHFQYQRLNGQTWASPTYVMQLQLPIPANILTKSRLITYFFLSIPSYVIILVFVYIMTPALQTTLTPLSYIAFSIIWICFSIYGGLIMPASDVGDKVNVKTMTMSAISLTAAIIFILTFFHLVLGYGVIYFTISIAQNWPLLSASVSILLAIVGFKFWQQMMINKTKKFDYF